MAVNDDHLQAAWQQHPTRQRRDRRTCLTDDTWARVLSKEATAAERAQAADHIGGCADCAAEYQLLFSVLRPWR